MSIFSNILAKIFPASHPAVVAAPPAVSPTAAVPGATSPAAAPPSSTPAAVPPAALAPVDVVKILNDRAAQNGEKLNWRTSIVDLMKLLDLDSSLAARKELAGELHYSGDTNDSAAMNVWLHKQVMSKLAQNGGKVPDEFKD